MSRIKTGSGMDFQRYMDHKYHKSVIQRINSARGDLEKMSRVSDRNLN